MSKIVVLTHNPKGKWGDVRPSVEQNKGYSDWGKSISVIPGQIVLLYISKSVFEIQYIMQVKNVNDATIDLDLIKKIEPEKSKKLSYELLKQHGLKPATVNFTLDNNVNLYTYVTDILGDDLKNIQTNGKPKLSLEKTNQPLNQILYGPPGTGKTYHTINKALEIIDGFVPHTREEAKHRFEELRKAEQIEFVTFHQSYGYEEFVEGIKAIPVGEEGNEDGSEMIYKPMAGVLKKLAKLAKYEFSKAQNTHKPMLKKYKLEAKSLNIQAEMIEDNANSFRVLKGSKIRKGHTPSFGLTKLKKEFLAKANYSEESEFYILNQDYTFQSMSASSSIVLGRSSNGNSEWKEIVDDTNLLSVTTERSNNTQNYILIIDEINRGNISKIFGELITLIEPSKRIGAEEAISVKLPYSGESFGVPSNLYIIGTMNTADRSIALMDTALRRRFEFTEMMPDLSVLENINVDNINTAKLLETINKRIEYLYDRDHTIGHAYFMSLKENASLEELERIFRYKIIPLLQEYFYDDWEKVMMVLGEGFIEKTTLKASIFDEDIIKNSDYIEDEKYIYTIKKTFEFSKFIK